MGERTTFSYWKTYDRLKFLGAVSENGQTFFAKVAESFTADVTIQFLQALQTEFGDHIHIVLDNAA